MEAGTGTKKASKENVIVMTFNDGYAAGILVMISLWLSWPIVNKAYDAYVKEREARKTPEQRRAEEAAAKVRTDALRAQWKMEIPPKDNRAKK